MRLSLWDLEAGTPAANGTRVVYDVARGEAHFGAASVTGHALVWQLGTAADSAEGALLSHPVHLDPSVDWIVRCDRVDFPPGGVAYRHTHPGPGIRYLLHGEIEIHADGRATGYGPGDAWFESGPEPVYAVASPSEETAFVRLLLLPAEWEGRRTIRHVDPDDEDRPKLQRATVFLEHPVPLG